MCQSTDCSHKKNAFDDMESDLDAGISSNPISATDMVDHSLQYAELTSKSTTQQRVEVKCADCRGSGRWVSYSGYTRGKCFKCDGKGFQLRAPGYEINKAKRVLVKARKEEELNANIARYWAVNPEIYSWLNRGLQRGNDFCTSLINAVNKFGELTPGQYAAVKRGIEKDSERRASAPAALLFPKIEQLVRVENMKLHLGVCKATMFQSGVVAIVSPTFGAGFYGTIQIGGEFRRARACTDEIVKVLQDVEARGLAAVKEIGIATGRCCVCSRMLTDPESIEQGIGPICADKAGAIFG
jgi:Family of unknown function (DUF6011)